MLKNYLKMAFRSLLRHRNIAFINIFGLSIGIAACLLILLFVRDELSYDRYNTGASNVYRVVKDFVNDDGSRLPDATTPPALAPAMQHEFPEVANVTRIFPGWGNKFLIGYGEKKFIEERLFRVDSSFFDVFPFPFVQGDARSAFKEVNSILITETTAKKYFGTEDPMHKVLKTDVGDMMVTAVLKDVPENSHFHFDFLIPIRKFGNIDGFWGWYNFYTYVRLRPHANPDALTPKIEALYKKNDKEGKNIFYTQPLTDIHLRSDLKWEIEPNSNILYVYAFSIIGLFVIAIACINYINLSTARSALRAKEIGVRKVTGAFRSLLVRQFLTESIVTVLFAFILGLFLARIALPAINELVRKNLSLSIFLQPLWLFGTLAAILVLGLISGLYPALYLSSIKPVWVLKGLSLPEGSVFQLRKVLVVFQFTISIGLIIGTAIVLQQVHYIQNARLGLNKDEVMIISDAGHLSRSDRESLLSELT
ncbi:MAG TPA: ABC transporter permease, partial [Puia sp.]|nr:ABC transporter permease [Puia sp.]